LLLHLLQLLVHVLLALRVHLLDNEGAFLNHAAGFTGGVARGRAGRARVRSARAVRSRARGHVPVALPVAVLHTRRSGCGPIRALVRGRQWFRARARALRRAGRVAARTT
jgi:hypothetical protein